LENTTIHYFVRLAAAFSRWGPPQNKHPDWNKTTSEGQFMFPFTTLLSVLLYKHTSGHLLP